jgi:hypothetical protein
VHVLVIPFSDTAVTRQGRKRLTGYRGSKAFFFEKKKQKSFCLFASDVMELVG